MTQMNYDSTPGAGRDEAMELTPVEGLEQASLVELEVRLHVHCSQNRNWRYHAAGRALARLREAGLDLDLAVPLSALAEKHREIISALNPAPVDEYASLSFLFSLPPIDHATARRIRAGAATLADAIRVIAARPDLKDAARTIGAVKKLAEIAAIRDGTPIDAIPARSRQIEARLARLTHADFGVAKGTFDSMKSRIRTAISLADMSAGRRLPTSQLLPAWQALATTIRAEANALGGNKRGGIMGHWAKLGRLTAFCHERRIAPSDVTDTTLAGLLEALTADETPGAFALVRDTVYAWERLQEKVTGFPGQKLARLYQRAGKPAGRLAFESLPIAFQSDWAAFELRVGPKADRSLATLVVGSSRSNPASGNLDGPDDNPFADGNDAFEDDSWALDQDLPELADDSDQAAQFSPAYLRQLKSIVLHAAIAAQEAGKAPTALGDILDPRRVEFFLRRKLQYQRLKDRAAPTRNNTLRNVATGLISVARVIGLPPAHIEQLMSLRDKVDPYFVKKVVENGKVKRKYSDARMGPRHKTRIAAMANDAALLNWFEMIPRLRRNLQRAVDAGRAPTPELTNDGVVMVLHALTRSCPLRRANLAKITVFGPHAWLKMPLQKGGGARLVIPREFVKNFIDITVELSEVAIESIAFYLEHVRPVIAARVGTAPTNPYLFPAGGMGHRAPESLNDLFVDRNLKVGGFTLNLHCQRHLAAKIILDRDPRQLEMVRQLLGHKNLRTTERYYAEVNAIFAQREYQGHLETKYAELVARRPGLNVHRPNIRRPIIRRPSNQGRPT